MVSFLNGIIENSNNNNGMECQSYVDTFVMKWLINIHENVTCPVEIYLMKDCKIDLKSLYNQFQLYPYTLIMIRKSLKRLIKFKYLQFATIRTIELITFLGNIFYNIAPELNLLILTGILTCKDRISLSLNKSIEEMKMLYDYINVNNEQLKKFTTWYGVCEMYELILLGCIMIIYTTKHNSEMLSSRYTSTQIRIISYYILVWFYDFPNICNHNKPIIIEESDLYSWLEKCLNEKQTEKDRVEWLEANKSFLLEYPNISMKIIFFLILTSAERQIQTKLFNIISYIYRHQHTFSYYKEKISSNNQQDENYMKDEATLKKYYQAGFINDFFLDMNILIDNKNNLLDLLEKTFIPDLQNSIQFILNKIVHLLRCDSEMSQMFKIKFQTLQEKIKVRGQ